MRRGLPGTLLALLAALATAATLLPTLASASEQAARLSPVNLRLDGDEGPWSSYNYFRLRWERPAVTHEGFPITGADYRVRDAAGNVVVPERHISGDVVVTGPFGVPWSPGAYTADLWLEGPGGERGPRESTMLGYDTARPGLARPLFPAVWASAQAAVVRISHPSGPLPVSGIRGYAISVDRGAGSLPCAGRERCTVAETDLDGGIGDDEIVLKELGEGTHYVRALAVSGAGMRSVETETAIVKVDTIRPDTSLAGAPPGWTNGPVAVTAKATDSMSGMIADGPNGPFTAIVIDGATPRTEPGPSASAVVSGQGVHTVVHYARDAVGNFSGDEPRGASLVRIDESPPAVAFARSQDPAEPERIEASVSDSLSGPNPTRGSIALRPAGSHQPFAPLPTAVSGDRLVARWNSDAFPAGTYAFRATAYDAAGNATSSERRANGARLVLPNPLKKRTELAAGFGGRRLVWQRCSRRSNRRRCHREEIEAFARRPAVRSVPYGRGVPFSGRLTSISGASVANLPIEIVETFAAGADLPQRTTAVATAADGTFATRLQPGPSRQIEVVFAGNRILTRSAAGPVRLDVQSGVSMHASSGTAHIGGAPVVFSGRVAKLGAPIPAAGHPVELQFRFPGSEWSEFRTVQTNGQGRFRYPYSFSDDDSRGIRFQFRAYAPAGDGWPYEPAFSRPVFVTGR